MAWGPFNAGGGGGSSGGTAADISYDNSKSGISAANVQEAIDALSVLTLTIQAVPAQSGSLTYTGSTQSPTWKGYDSSMMTIGGVTSGINAGTYTATFTPIGKYVWTDGTQEAKSVSWTIGRAEVKNVPAQTGSVTYNGSAQSPAWSNYNSSQLTIGGTSSATNAGSYSATFTPTSNYKWSDGTTTAKSASWTIGKATGSITLSASSLSLTYPKTSGTITVTRPGSGTVTASSGSTNIATVSVSGTTITVTAKATGSATITVNVGADTNYTAPSSKTFTVAVTLVSKTLSSNSWAVIKAVSDAGQGANYWSVGATKSVTINGKVGATTISSLKVDAFIIGFNHNSGKEGSNRIHFLLGKISGKFVGLVDSSYGSTTSTSGAFTMNTSNTNSGGWGSSQMRSKVLGSASSPTSPTANTLLAALPADLRAVMKSCTKYTDNKGGGNTASNVSSTTDYLFLLSEYEVFATHQYCNDAEPNYQAQYDYFKAGNSKVANKHSATGTAAVWWLRSSATPTPSAPFRLRGRRTITALAMRMVLCPALWSNPPAGVLDLLKPTEVGGNQQISLKKSKGRVSAPREFLKKDAESAITQLSFECIHAIKNAIQYFQNLFVRRYCMATNKRVFTLRLSDEVFDKIGVLATKEHRSITNYIEYVLLKHLEEVEREQGEIDLDDPKGD